MINKKEAHKEYFLLFTMDIFKVLVFYLCLPHGSCLVSGSQYMLIK